VTDSFSQSNYLNNFNKGCDWLILACFIREQMLADATLPHLKNEVWFDIINSETMGKLMDFFILQQIKKPRLCSVLL